jgi:uncharacterized protein
MKTQNPELGENLYPAEINEGSDASVIRPRYKSSFYNILVKTKDGNYLVFNTMTGTLALLKNNEFHHAKIVFENPSDFNCNDKKKTLIFESAIKAGFIINEKINELDVLKMISFMGRFSSEHFHLTIMPTLQCNFACVYCYEKQKPGIMQRETRKALAKWVENKIKSCRLFSVAWFGGEPLLAFKCISELTAHFKRLCSEANVEYRAGITTNGYLMSKRIVDRFLDLGIASIQITLDGPSNIHNKMRILKNGQGTYDEIVKNLDYLCQTRPEIEVYLRVNYNQQTIRNIPRFLSDLPDNIRQNAHIYPAEIYHCSAFLGYSGTITAMASAEINNTALQRTKRQKLRMTMLCLKCKEQTDAGQNMINFPIRLKPGYCEADYSNHFVVDPKGDLFKCTVSFQPELRVGRIQEDGDAVFDLPKLSIWLSKDPFSRKKCQDCRILPICMGGCHSSSMKAPDAHNCSTPLTHRELMTALRMLYDNRIFKRLCAQ